MSTVWASSVPFALWASSVPPAGTADARTRVVAAWEAVHAGWAQVVVPEPATFSAPKSEPWGAVEFHIIDVHGNLVRLGGFPSS